MKNQILVELRLRLDTLERQNESMESEDFQEQILTIENEIRDVISLSDYADSAAFTALLKRIKKIKNDNDFYDEDGELDMMFPNE